MTTQLSSTTTCPIWCAGQHDADEEGVTFHSRPVGSLGVAITAQENPDGTIGDALIYVPETHEMLADGMSDDITPERAAHLAQAMLLAVAIIDGGDPVSPLTIRDTITGRTLTCERYDVTDALAPWFVAAPDDVARGVADLQAAVLRQEPTDGLLALLGLAFEDGAA